MSIYNKLLNIQKAAKALKKDKKSYNYEYLTGDKLLNFLRPLMDNEGIILKQEVLNIENTRQDYTIWDAYMNDKKGGYKTKNEMFTTVKMRFTWVDCETGETDVNLFAANGQNEWEKGLGSALTFGERYFLLKYFHIPTDHDDIDNPLRKEAKGSKEGIDETKTPEFIKWSKTIEELKSMDEIEAYENKYKGQFEKYKYVPRMLQKRRVELQKQ